MPHAGLATLAALGIALLIIATVEWVWRAADYQPNVPNTVALWAYHRRQASRNGGRGVVLLGTSRIRAAFSTDLFRRRFPTYSVAQLGIEESSSVNVFRDLADDERFHGVVLWELTEGTLLPAQITKYAKAQFLDSYHQGLSWNDDLELAITGHLQESLCCRDPELALDKVFFRWLDKRQSRARRFITTRFDRRQLVDLRGFFPEGERAKEVVHQMQKYYADDLEPPPSADDWLREALRLEPPVRRLLARGGQIVFLALPWTGESLKLSDHYFPKDRFWDRFAARTSASTIHFRDIPALAKTSCPDTSHLDYHDADEFTNNLLDELESRGILVKRGVSRR